MSSVATYWNSSASEIIPPHAVKQAIWQAIQCSPHKGLRKLDVDCGNSSVRISGVVGSYFQKLIAAEEIQVVTPHGWRVYNDVIVRERDPRQF